MNDNRTIDTRVSGEPVGDLVTCLARAFQDDPGLAYIMPDPDKRAELLPSFFEVMTRQSLRHGEVLAAANGEAASLWYPAGKVREGWFEGMRDSLWLLRILGTGVLRGVRAGDAMYAHHPDPQPHAYLRFVGVAPEAQGKGWGGKIIREGIDRAAREGLGVLLETATESNLAIYTRLGFHITETWFVPGGGPQFWTMIRPNR